MSFSQQSRSDLAAAEADARRRQLDGQSEAWRRRSPAESRAGSVGISAKVRAWVRRAVHR
jgi:hypothetical protein